MLTWNINGLCRKLTDCDFLSYVNDYDILLLQETWINSKINLNLNLNGYFCHHIFGTKSPGAKKGRYSGGISVYAKNYLKDKLEIVEKNSTGLLWIKLTSELFSFNEDVFICSVYIPPAGSKIFNALDVNLWDEIEKGIELYSSKGKIFITGDMNGRTSDYSDILHFDRYIENNDLFQDMSHVPPRTNKDKILDQHGRRLLDLCKSTNFIIANGRLCDDFSVGEYTFCSTQGMSTLDYVLLESTDLYSLSNFQVLPLNEFSDHAPLFFSFTSYKSRLSESMKHDETVQETKVFWDATKEQLFKNELIESHDTLLLIENSELSINDKVIEFSKYLSEHSLQIFGHTYTAHKNKGDTKRKQSPWFNENCKNAQKDFARTRNKFLKNKTDVNRHAFVKHRTKYNRVKSKAKQLYKINEGKKLSDLAKRQPKRFWKKIKSFRKSKKK